MFIPALIWSPDQVCSANTDGSVLHGDWGNWESPLLTPAAVLGPPPLSQKHHLSLPFLAKICQKDAPAPGSPWQPAGAPRGGCRIRPPSLPPARMASRHLRSPVTQGWLLAGGLPPRRGRAPAVGRARPGQPMPMPARASLGSCLPALPFTTVPGCRPNFKATKGHMAWSIFSASLPGQRRCFESPWPFSPPPQGNFHFFQNPTKKEPFFLFVSLLSFLFFFPPCLCQLKICNPPGRAGGGSCCRTKG